LAEPFRACDVIVLIGLGTWQLKRKAWKEGLIAALAERTSAEPVPLARAGTLVRARSMNRRVSAC